jgi:hypothetical protein
VSKRTNSGLLAKEWKAAFLTALGEHGMVTLACQTIGIGRSTAYEARQSDEQFALAWADVEELTTEKMEREAYRRAVEGVQRDVLFQGDKVGEERHYSDTLLIFMLKSRRPDRYRDNVKIEHSGTVAHRLEAPEDAQRRAVQAAGILERARLGAGAQDGDTIG